MTHVVVNGAWEDGQAELVGKFTGFEDGGHSGGHGWHGGGVLEMSESSHDNTHTRLHLTSVLTAAHCPCLTHL